MSALIELAERCEVVEANALLGEQTKALLAEVWNLMNPRPPHRMSRRPDGELWGGDGLGPITPEHREWGNRRKFYFGCLDLGAFVRAALTLADEETAAQALREAFSFIQAVGWPDGDFTGSLARATVAAILRARANQDTPQ